MARYVTVSCLSGQPLQAGTGESFDHFAQRVVEVWGARMDAVLPDQPDIIVLPEMADGPHPASMSPTRQGEYFRDRPDHARAFFADVAAQHQCYVAYSSIHADDEGALRNTTRIFGRDGLPVGSYDKNHLVIEEHDVLGVEYGTRAPTFELDFGRVACAICFDLNFDELRYQYARAHPELILFSSAYHGGLMQNYWAYSTRSYLAAAIRPPAPSAIVSPLGQTMASSTNYFDHVTVTVNLDYVVLHLDHNRAKFGQIKREYGPAVRIHDPGRLGAVLLTAETAELTAQMVVDQFGLELLDDYLNRSRDHRRSHIGATPPAPLPDVANNVRRQ